MKLEGKLNFFQILHHSERILKNFCTGIKDFEFVDVLERYLITFDEFFARYLSNFVKMCTFYASTVDAFIILLKEVED